MIRNRKTIHNSMQVHESITAYTTHLSNGIRVVSEYIPTVASFSLGVWIKAGSRDETNETAGAVHFLEHLAFRRTLKEVPKHWQMHLNRWEHILMLLQQKNILVIMSELCL